MTRVAMVGTGYVGLVTGACLAALGHEVVCVDLAPERVEAINSGRTPIHEPGLDELIDQSGGRLRATLDLSEAVAATEMIFIAVGTPSREDGSIDLGQVIEAARGIGQALVGSPEYHVVVVKSTVVPGATREMILPALEEGSGMRSGVDFGVAVNPEFLTEGTAVVDFLRPDRIVIGAEESEVAKRVADLYRPLGEVTTIITTPTTAELIKYASNTLLATMISFSNEMADLASAVGDVDIVEVMAGVHSSRYLTTDGLTAPISSFLEAGCGFGGSCLPKDTRALISEGRARGVALPLLEAVLRTNQERAGRVIDLLLRHYPDLVGRKVSVLGLAFKPDTDDTRESPAFPVVERLLGAGALVTVHDPVVPAGSLPPAWGDRVQSAGDLAEALTEAEAVVLITAWDPYRRLPQLFSDLGISPLVVDGRRLLSPASVEYYEGIGR
jgi:UDPglucose 6-dehydrogenase/GDP-mannose 6-dehydrogenase